MVITEVRIKLMEDNNENERLQAFCSVTFDDAFVVRDLKIVRKAPLLLVEEKPPLRCKRWREEERERPRRHVLVRQCKQSDCWAVERHRGCNHR